jgi:hypothetical protein
LREKNLKIFQKTGKTGDSGKNRKTRKNRKFPGKPESWQLWVLRGATFKPKNVEFDKLVEI